MLTRRAKHRAGQSPGATERLTYPSGSYVGYRLHLVLRYYCTVLYQESKMQNLVIFPFLVIFERRRLKTTLKCHRHHHAPMQGGRVGLDARLCQLTVA